MRSSFITAALALVAGSNGLNILMGNDDGFGSANLRELYRMLRAAGHNAWIVAPQDDESGQGGRSVFTTSRNLTAPTQFNLVPAGAPSIGQDPHDSHIWYYNGTPAACTFVALDYVLPNFANFTTPDLFLSGPNFGLNPGPFFYTLSGTIGSTYAAIERNIPGIALSASNKIISYQNITNTTNEATWAAQVSFNLTQQIIKNTPSGQRVFPLGYGLNVNIPPLNASYHTPPYVLSRITGGSDVDIAVYNASTGLFRYANAADSQTQGANQCINGDCSLPGETDVVAAGGTAVSVFTVDYDAPTSANTIVVDNKLSPLVANATSTGDEEHGHHPGWKWSPWSPWGPPKGPWSRRDTYYHP